MRLKKTDKLLFHPQGLLCNKPTNKMKAIAILTCDIINVLTITYDVKKLNGGLCVFGLFKSSRTS